MVSYCLWSLQLVFKDYCKLFFYPYAGNAIAVVDKWQLPIIKAKKVKEKFGGTKKKLYLCNRIWERCLMIQKWIQQEGWVSGWNHQFAKLTCGLPYRGFESPTFRKHYSKLHRWSIHLMVRIQDSQSWHRGSIPLSTTFPLFTVSLQVWKRYWLSIYFSPLLLCPHGRRDTRYTVSASLPYRWWRAPTGKPFPSLCWTGNPSTSTSMIWPTIIIDTPTR